MSSCAAAGGAAKVLAGSVALILAVVMGAALVLPGLWSNDVDPVVPITPPGDPATYPRAGLPAGRPGRLEDRPEDDRADTGVRGRADEHGRRTQAPVGNTVQRDHHRNHRPT